MKILIVAATRFEIQPLISHLGAILNSENKYIRCSYKNLEVDTLVTGIGMAATAYYVGKQLNSGYNFVINAGICGSFNNNLPVGAVVNVIEDCFSELGAEDGNNFFSLEELNLEGNSKFLNTNFTLSNSIIELLPKVNGITVNTVHGNDKSIEKTVHKFHPIVESMEGAAFMLACEAENVPYMQLRAVSNYVERRNKENWNIPLAIKALNEKIIEILNAFE
ncbi:MAG: futalosine hydrolase [Bacteroidota bacterium]